MFLLRDIDQPDTVSLMLMRSGDVESNPGPSTRSAANRKTIAASSPEPPTPKARTRKKPPNKNSNVDPKGTAPTCRGCRKRFNTKMLPVTCHQCENQFHKSCTGDSRFKIDKILKYGRKWTCKFCKFGLTAEEDNTSQTYKELPDACMNCKIIIRKGADFLCCSECKRQLHKKKDCSGMTIQQLKNLDRKTWKCEGCQGINANPKPSSNPTHNPVFRSKATTTCSKLTILQWNADSILSKVQELREYIQEKEIDLFLIQETKLITRDKTPKFKDFTILRQDRVQRKGDEKNRGGGLLIGIRDTIPYRTSRSEFAGGKDEISEWMSIEIPIKGGQKLRFNNIYIPPIRTQCSTTSREKKTELSTDKWMTSNFDCLFGDFNAKSEIWDDQVTEGKIQTDSRGTMIEEWLACTSMICLNDGSPTRTDRNNRIDSAPDISFIHASLTDKFTWKVKDELGSDHKPIIITYEDEMNIPLRKEIPLFKWKLKDADWTKYHQETEKEVDSIEDGSPEEMEEHLREIITQAARKNIGKKKVNRDSKPWLTPEIKAMIKKRNELRADLSKKNRREWVLTCRKVTEMVIEEKERCWKEYVEQLDMKTNPKKVWQTIRGMDGRHSDKSKNEALVIDGVALVEDKDKAEAFAKTYRSFSRLKARKLDRALRRTVRNLNKKTKDYQPGLSEQEITIEELNRVINEAGLNKAAGNDEISYELIKNLGPKARDFILKLFNKIWMNGAELPRNWRIAIIITLLKEGKDPELTSSYRPISLTACLGKLLEKIIADRLTYILESRGLITNNQAGFRQGRCTTDQVLKLTQSATDQIHSRKENNATVVTFFDYEKAYDKVWRDGLLHKLIALGIPWRYTRYVRNFLSGRRTMVDVNGTRSKTFILKEGLPQGSAISPLLFLVFINDIDVDLSMETLASLFADDTSIWCQGGKLEELAKKGMQPEIDKIIKWADEWKMAINSGKTKAMTISSSTAATGKELNLKVDGKPLGQVKKFKFLGITIDADLRFSDHATSLAKKCKKRNNILKSMAWKDWGNSLEIQRTLYIQYIRSCLDYASSSWVPWIADCHMKKLETVQNEALRAMAGLTKTCPNEFLNLETNIEPLRLRYEKNDEITMDRYLRLPETDSRRQLAERAVPQRLKTRIGWRTKTQKNTEEAKIGKIARAEVTPPLPPWMRHDNLTIAYTPLKKKKSDYQPEELKSIALQKILSYNAKTTIYTDGSTSGRQENGGAGFFIIAYEGEEILKRSVPAGELCSSFTGECVALLNALEWVAEEETKGKKLEQVLICTDSMSMAMALENHKWKDPEHWMKEIKLQLSILKTNIVVLWIPSHVDIAGNEEADALANTGATMDQTGIPVAHSTVKARIKRRRWNVEHERAVEIYGKRRKPKMEVEKKWPRKVRTLYARLRTNHAKELKSYLKFIEAEDDDLCEAGCGAPDTIKHVLCECQQTSAARQKYWSGETTMAMMVTEPEVCRRILATRFTDLAFNNRPPELVAKTTIVGSPIRVMSYLG